VWPASLVTIALNSALHRDDSANTVVRGPFGRTYGMTRYKFFLWAFGAMFIYFWFPNYLFEVLTFFSWMTWISPTNLHLEILTGFRNGLGVRDPSGSTLPPDLMTDPSNSSSTPGLHLTGMSCSTTVWIPW
jgi:hypothetical protein